jgi:hypothetical protein
VQKQNKTKNKQTKPKPAKPTKPQKTQSDGKETCTANHFSTF